jgi:hypothetical protein
MFFHKKLNIHWSVLLPSLAVLSLVALALGAVALFAGQSEPAEEMKATPEAVAVRYAASVETLRQESAASEDPPAVSIAHAEEVLLSLRVPKERLDVHLAAVIQLRALIRDLSALSASEARLRLIEILRPL